MTGKTRLGGMLGMIATLCVAGLLGCSQTTEVDAPESGTTLTMSDIQERVSMTDQQAAALQPALDRWRNAEGTDGSAGGVPSALAFVAEGAKVLSRAQLVTLISTVREQDLRHGNGVRGGRGPRGGPRGHGTGILQDLGLSVEQMDALRVAHAELRSAIDALRESVAEGTITEDEFEQGVADARAAYEAARTEILTEDQLAQLEAAQLEHLVERLTARIEELEDWVARRVDVLTDILALTDGQATEIENILTATGPEMEAILAGLKDESLSVADARMALRDLRSATNDAVIAVLTDEQVELYESIKGFGHGPHGHGPRR